MARARGRVRPLHGGALRYRAAPPEIQLMSPTHPRDGRGGYGLAVASGKLITIEGLDGAGKTTLASALAERIRASGVARVELLREPGGVAASERIRTLVKDPDLRISERAEALLYAAARAQLVEERVMPLLADGAWVLLDRFIDSSLAYQGAGRGLGVQQVLAINLFATRGLTADRTLLLRLAPQTGRARQQQRDAEPDRLEREDERFFEEIARAYDELADAEPRRIRVVDATQPSPEVLRQAVEAIDDLLPAHAHESHD
jgi:dTMP kinase